MKKDNINASIKGEVEIYALLKDGSRELLLSKDNALQVVAKRMIFQGLSGDLVNGKLSSVALYKNSHTTLLALATVSSWDHSVADELTMTAVLAPGYFDDTITSLALINSALVEFSVLTGFSVYKDLTTAIEVKWKLTFINLNNL
jgi:hypothetical protein